MYNNFDPELIFTTRDRITASLETLVGVAPTWRSLDNPRQRMSYEDRLSSEGDARKRRAIADKFLFAESVATQQRDVLKVRIYRAVTAVLTHPA